MWQNLAEICNHPHKHQNHHPTERDLWGLCSVHMATRSTREGPPPHLQTGHWGWGNPGGGSPGKCESWWCSSCISSSRCDLGFHQMGSGWDLGQVVGTALGCGYQCLSAWFWDWNSSFLLCLDLRRRHKCRTWFTELTWFDHKHLCFHCFMISATCRSPLLIHILLL